MPTLEERITRLENIEAIRCLQAKYQRCLDTRDFDGLAECFDDDVTSSYGNGDMSYFGKDSVIQFLCSVMTLDMPSTHLIHGGEIIVLDDDKCILVELKGCDVSKACIQLNSTLDIFKKKLLKVNNYDYYCRAVVTSMPSPNNYPTSYKILLKNLNNCKNKLICKSKKMEEKI